MVRAGREDPELNLLVGVPERRVGRRGFLQVAGPGRRRGGRLRRRHGWPGGATTTRPAAAGAAAPVSGNRVNERLLNVYNWSDYIDDRTIPLFQALTNLRVNYDVFSSNEDLLAKLRAGPTELRHHRPDQRLHPHLPEARPDRAAAPGPHPQPRQPRQGVRRDRLRPGQPLPHPVAVGDHRGGLQPPARARRQGRLLGGRVQTAQGCMRGHVSLLREVTDLISCALIFLGRDPNSTKDGNLQEVVKLVRSVRTGAQ